MHGFLMYSTGSIRFPAWSQNLAWFRFDSRWHFLGLAACSIMLEYLRPASVTDEQEAALTAAAARAHTQRVSADSQYFRVGTLGVPPRYREHTDFAQLTRQWQLGSQPKNRESRSHPVIAIAGGGYAWRHHRAR